MIENSNIFAPHQMKGFNEQPIQKADDKFAYDICLRIISELLPSIKRRREKGNVIFTGHF